MNAETNSLKAIRDREKAEKDAAIKQKCEALAISRVGSEDEFKKLSNTHKGIWFLPVLDDNDEVELLLVLKPIDRNIISYASSKLEDEGISGYVEAAMRECTIKNISDMQIIDDDEYFVSAFTKFHKIMEGKKTALLKR